MKIFFRRIHLYMALVAGLVIMTTCLTGGILVFEKELQQLFNKKRYFVEAATTRLPADSLVKNVQLKVPGSKISGIKIYSNPERTTEVSLSKPTEVSLTKPSGLSLPKPGKEKAPEGIRLTAFVNPYSGEVVEIYNHRNSFFYKVMDLHRWMLAGDTGKLITGICTLLFVFILITGIILWWPKNKQLLKQRLKIKSGAGFKRLNHDFHIVLGFYCSIFLLVFAFTALAWSFEWFNKGIYSITGTSMERARAPKSIAADTNRISIEQAFRAVTAEINNSAYYNITFPKDSSETFGITVLPPSAAHETASDSYFVDAYKGNIAGIQRFSDRNAGQRIRATFRPVHVASVWGLPSKIIGVITCFLGVFFPVSGYIMWINRIRKKKRRTAAAKQE